MFVAITLTTSQIANMQTPRNLAQMSRHHARLAVLVVVVQHQHVQLTTARKAAMLCLVRFHVANLVTRALMMTAAKKKKKKKKTSLAVVTTTHVPKVDESETTMCARKGRALMTLAVMHQSHAVLTSRVWSETRNIIKTEP